MNRYINCEQPPFFLWLLIWSLSACFCWAQDYDWTQPGHWTPELTVNIETSKEGYKNFPFRETITLPGHITKISHHGGFSLLSVRLYSVSEHAVHYDDDEEFKIDRELGFTNWDKGFEVEKSNDFHEIIVKLPSKLAQKFEVAEIDSRDWNYELFLFDKKSNGLRAIHFQEISGWSQIHYEDNLLTWVEDTSRIRVDENQLPIIAREVISSGRGRRNQVIRRKYGPDLIRHYRFDGFRFSYKCEGKEDQIWIKERYLDDEGEFIEELNWVNHMFWYTPEGVSVYVFSGESDTGADINGSTTMVASVSASEMFGKPKGGVVVFNDVREIYTPSGYLVMEAANSKAKVLKRVDADSSVNVRAYRDNDGVRYYVSDWSYDRISEGITPNYIRIQP
ncbi:MAG: hypothetical protein P1U86_05675 [Verrucomicrobiales bacterium]|nr:hypothetical protein [Verrucomicrobiales bacterium]